MASAKDPASRHFIGSSLRSSTSPATDPPMKFNWFPDQDRSTWLSADHGEAIPRLGRHPGESPHGAEVRGCSGDSKPQSGVTSCLETPVSRSSRFQGRGRARTIGDSCNLDGSTLRKREFSSPSPSSEAGATSWREAPGSRSSTPVRRLRTGGELHHRRQHPDPAARAAQTRRHEQRADLGGKVPFALLLCASTAVRVYYVEVALRVIQGSFCRIGLA